MTKNYMPDIAKMLGVELEEEFKIVDLSNECKLLLNYKFTENGLYLKDETGTWWSQTNVLLHKLLKGEMIIKKLPWKPKAGETYYLPILEFTNFAKCTWTDNVLETTLYTAGMIFRSLEDCKAALPVLRKKYFGDDNNGQ